MANRNVLTYNDSTGPTLQTSTANNASSAVVRDTDNSINVGQVNAVNVVNTGITTVALGVSTAAAGSVQGDAATLPAGTGSIYPTTAADGTKGVIINAADAVVGRRFSVTNGAAAVLKIYPPSGSSLNALSANAAFSTASGKGAIVECLTLTTFAVYG